MLITGVQRKKKEKTRQIMSQLNYFHCIQQNVSLLTHLGQMLFNKKIKVFLNLGTTKVFLAHLSFNSMHYIDVVQFLVDFDLTNMSRGNKTNDSFFLKLFFSFLNK